MVCYPSLPNWFSFPELHLEYAKSLDMLNTVAADQLISLKNAGTQTKMCIHLKLMFLTQKIKNQKKNAKLEDK